MTVQSETKVFLKYKRKKECWVCPLCDTENHDNKCYLCGSIRLSSSVVKPAWDNMVHVQNNTSINNGFVNYENVPKEYDVTENSGNGKNIGLIIAWIAIVITLIAVIVANS